MTLDMTRFVARYLVEARGHLTTITRGLPALQHGCCDRETIHALFVSAHTIKGGAGMLKLKPIAELADHLEEALSALLEGRVPPSGRLADLLGSAAAAIETRLDAAAAGVALADADQTLCAALARAAAGED